MEPLAIDLPSEMRRILQFIADAGLLGSSPEDVAAYLITRGLDDMTRAGVLSLSSVEACP